MCTIVTTRLDGLPLTRRSTGESPWVYEMIKKYEGKAKANGAIVSYPVAVFRYFYRFCVLY